MQANRSMRLIACLAAVFAALLVSASPALGQDVRFAEVSPGDGDPAVCAQADPCSLDNAVEDLSVQDGDEVVVLPGTYDLGMGIVAINDEISVHGAAGGPRPVITSAGTTTLVTSSVLRNMEVRDLELVSTGAGPALRSSGNGAMAVTVERIVARASDAGTQACLLHNTLIRDSVCHNTAAGPAAGFVGGGLSGSGTVSLRNVTAYAPADTAFDITAQSGATIIWDAKNVIARGGSVDITVEEQVGGDVTFTLENANYDTQSVSGGATVTSPSNQTAPPLLVDPDDGDYRQSPGSPTIDAGAAADLLGTADLDGDQRAIDGNCDGTAAPDIGADEFNTGCPSPEPEPEVGDTSPPVTTITAGRRNKTKKRDRGPSSSLAPTTERLRASSASSTRATSRLPALPPFQSGSRRASTPSRSGLSNQAGNIGTPATYNWKVKKKKK